MLCRVQVNHQRFSYEDWGDIVGHPADGCPIDLL